MSGFLSSEWVAALDERLGTVELDSAIDLTVRHIVGDVTYVVRVSGGRVRALLDDDAAADVILREDYGTAAAISRGELTAQQAVAIGRLKLAGDVGALRRHGGALAALSAATDEL